MSEPQPQPPHQDLDPGFLRQRRNLMLSSSLLILLVLSKKITSVPFLGVTFEIWGGETMILGLALLVNGYFHLRAKAYAEKAWLSVAEDDVYDFFSQPERERQRSESLVRHPTSKEISSSSLLIVSATPSKIKEIANQYWIQDFHYRRYPSDIKWPFVFSGIAMSVASVKLYFLFFFEFRYFMLN